MWKEKRFVCFFVLLRCEKVKKSPFPVHNILLRTRNKQCPLFSQYLRGVKPGRHKRVYRKYGNPHRRKPHGTEEKHRDVLLCGRQYSCCRKSASAEKRIEWCVPDIPCTWTSSKSFEKIESSLNRAGKNHYIYSGKRASKRVTAGMQSDHI